MRVEPDSSGPTEGSGRVILRSFPTHHAAQLAAAQLEANGIACWVTSDDCGGLLPNLTFAGGVRLLVSKTDENAAQTLLDTPISSTETFYPNKTAPENPEPSPAPPPGRIEIAQIFVGAVIGALATWLFLSTAPPTNSPKKTHYHYAANGKADQEWIYNDGELVEYRRDRNLDGHWDVWDYYGPLGLERVDYDNNFDGKADSISTYSNGDILGSQKDNDFNGLPDEFGIYKFRVLQEIDFRPNGSKFTTTKEIYTNGVLSEVWRGGDSSGAFKEVVNYDAFFNPVSTNTFSQWLLSVPQSSAP
jgi:hypothetical protein